VAVKKVAKRAVRQAVARKVNREGQRWTDERPGMTLRLPLDLREAITEESRVKRDLARIVLYALSHVDHDKVDIQQTRKAGMELSNPQLLHVGADARLKLKEWAEAEGVSVNAIVAASSKSSSSASRKARRSGKNSDWRFVRTGDSFRVEWLSEELPCLRIATWCTWQLARIPTKEESGLR